MTGDERRHDGLDAQAGKPVNEDRRERAGRPAAPASDAGGADVQPTGGTAPPTKAGFDALAAEARRDFRVGKDGQYDDGQLGRLRDELKSYRLTRQERGRALSWERLSAEVGMSPGTLNAWAHGKYGGDEQRVAGLVDLFLAHQAERRGRLAFHFATIDNARAALGAVREGVRQCSIAAVIGAPGCGKTMIARAYCADRPGTAFLATVDEHTGTKAGVTRLIYATIAKAAGLGAPPASSWQRWDAILAFFRGNRNSVLLIDEAQKLTGGGLEVLRDLHDKSDAAGDRNLPIVLFGDPRFYRLLLRSRREQSSPIAPQLSRRIAPIFDFERDGVQGDGSGDLYSVEDLVRVIRNERLRLVDDEGMRWLTMLANMSGYGRLGLAVEVLKTAHTIAEKTPLGVRELRIALRMTIGPDGMDELNLSSGGELLRATA